MITQDKNKYKTPKYRFVVRITNKDVICQIFSSDLTHDVCLASAYSHELQRYGLNLGLTNYAAAYCTGLLLARRVNVKFGLDKDYEGNTTIDGADYNVEASGERKPFKALLDVGLTRTTTGARIFGALKGACDGGVDVPHKDRRFPGSKREEGEWVADPEVHRKYIFGGHVSEYMTKLQGADEEKYNRQFKRFVDAGIGAEDLEGLYEEVHKKIRADPVLKRDAMDLGSFKKRETAKPAEVETKRWRRAALSLQQRKDRIRQKLTSRGIPSIKAEIAAYHVQAKAAQGWGAATPAPKKPAASTATPAADVDDGADGGDDGEGDE